MCSAWAGAADPSGFWLALAARSQRGTPCVCSLGSFRVRFSPPAPGSNLVTGASCARSRPGACAPAAPRSAGPVWRETPGPGDAVALSPLSRGGRVAWAVLGSLPALYPAWADAPRGPCRLHPRLCFARLSSVERETPSSPGSTEPLPPPLPFAEVNTALLSSSVPFLLLFFFFSQPSFYYVYASQNSIYFSSECFLKFL